MNTYLMLAVGLALAPGVTPGWSVTPTREEFSACRSGSDHVFATSDAAAVPAYLKLLYEDVADLLTRGRSWRGTAYQLGETRYTHGIAFNSTKHLLVHLDNIGKSIRHDLPPAFPYAVSTRVQPMTRPISTPGKQRRATARNSGSGDSGSL